MAGNFNAEFLELADIVPAFIPVDMQSGANNGTWVNMALCDRVVCVLFKAVGTAGDDPVFTLKQATDGAGTGAKALTFTRIRTKIGTITTAANQVWSVVTQSASGTYTATSAASAALIVVEVLAKDLDINNGFTNVQLSIPDVGSNAQLGCAFYIPWNLKQPTAINPTFLD